MLNWKPFYKLLGIPDDVTEPTPYQLLGISPGGHSPAQVRHLLDEKKKMLRRNTPGPQFIPIMSMLEQELDLAAAQLVGDLESKQDTEGPKRKTNASRRPGREPTWQQLLLMIAKAILSAAGPDGTLGEENRRAVARRLRRLGLSKESIQWLLAKVPKPDRSAGGQSGQPQANQGNLGHRRA